MYRAIILDLDGTLLDTLEDLTDSLNHALARAGLAGHPPQRVRSFIGNGARKLIQRALPSKDQQEPELIDRCLEKFIRQYRQCWDNKTRRYPGVALMLDGLEERSLRLALLSNKPHDFTGALAERFLNRWSFARVWGARTGLPLKPDPASTLDLLSMMGVPPQQGLFLGDSATDMKTARAAGVVAVGAAWGFRDRLTLEAGGAHVVAERPEEVLDFVDGGGVVQT